MSWVEKNRKINNRGGRGDDYSGLESNRGNAHVKCRYKSFCRKFSNEAISTKGHVSCQEKILCRNQFYNLKYNKQLIKNKFYMPKYQGERNHYLLPEAVTQRFSGKKVFLKMALNSQKNNCARVSLLINIQISASNSGGCFLATDDFLDFNDFLTASYFKHPSFNIKLQYHTFNTYMEETNRRGSVYC